MRYLKILKSTSESLLLLNTYYLLISVDSIDKLVHYNKYIFSLFSL